MKILTKRQILLLHSELAEVSGGSSELRDEGLLDSAISAPFQSFGGIDLYPDIILKAARLGFGLIKNHPFVDGNKRIGAHAMIAFLEVNSISLEYEDDELIEIILSVASGVSLDEDLVVWLKDHII